MTSSQARDAVNGAAIVVAGIYFYRRLIEPATGPSQTRRQAQPKSIPKAAGQIVGVGPLASTGRFVVGFGFTFLVLSLMEGASPQLAGSFAILIATGAILGNGVEVTKDIQTQLNEKQQTLSKLKEPAQAPPAPTTQIVSWEPSMPTVPRVNSVTV